MKLWIDTETRSRVPLSQGLARYATQVEVIIVTWALGRAQVRTWDVLRHPSMPQPLIDDLKRATELWAHKADFDRTVLGRQDWWPKKYNDTKLWHCTMALALAHGLPGGLDKLCEIFKVSAENAKHKDNKVWINLFCKPNKAGEYNDAKSHPEEWKKFLAYAASDITSMREVHSKCPKWNLSPAEREVWLIDQEINDRGVAVDVEFATAAVRATTEEKERLGKRTEELTEGALLKTTQRDRLLAFLLLEYGVVLPDLKADTVERRLEDPELPEFVKELLRIRLQATKASTSKYKRILQMEVGGRLYNTLQYCAANRTGRWGGRGFQPQNLQRPKHKFPEIMAGINAMKAGCEDIVTDNVMGLAASCMRSVIIAPPGKKLVVADLANIEGRVLAWLAGEQWKLDAFAAYDRKEGPDLYKVSYGRAFDISPEDVEDDSDERQIGKVMELALGYAGGVGAFVTMAVTYGVDLDLLAEKAWPSIPPHVLRDSQRVWAWAVQQRRTLGLGEKVYIVCEALKQLWRAAHPETVTLWEMVEVAARNAIQNPNVKFDAGKLQFERIDNWLRMRLPSGRYLCYPAPELRGNTITYMGVNVYNKRWHRISTYGGKVIENADQGMSRDVFAYALPLVQSAGYPLTLLVHDEADCEVPDEPRYTDAELSGILAAGHDWCRGLPLSAKGFTTDRYRKG